MLILCNKSIHPRPYAGKKKVILAEARLGIGMARAGLGSARLGSTEDSLGHRVALDLAGAGDDAIKGQWHAPCTPTGKLSHNAPR